MDPFVVLVVPAWHGGDVERIRLAGWRFYWAVHRNVPIKDEPRPLDSLPRAIRADMALAVRRHADRFVGELDVAWNFDKPALGHWPARFSELPPEVKSGLDALVHVALYRILYRWGWWWVDEPARSPMECPVILAADMVLLRAALVRLGPEEPEELDWVECRPEVPNENTGTNNDAVLASYVTLDQAAGMVHKSKRTLERYKTKGTLPKPAVEGGGGRADLYDWSTMRPWLIETFGVQLPIEFPARRQG